MNRLLACAVLALAMPTQALGSASEADPPLCNTNPCVILWDGGGFVKKYQELAQRIRLTGWKLIIDGECYSACVELADRARPFVCLTPAARFFIHKWSQELPSGSPGSGNPRINRGDNVYSDDLQRWVDFNGGQPTTGWLYLPVEQAVQFWPLCTEDFIKGDTTDD
jgi:hypothetical protein